MTHATCFNLVPSDLAGVFSAQPDLWHLGHRIQTLVNRYLSLEHLHDRLEDLPQQFCQPQPRPWPTIDWHAIQPDQVAGIDLTVFLALVRGTIDTEAPIRGYTRASRQYLQDLYPQMARFVGGRVDDQGCVIDPGLWEKEERRHTPALAKIYHQLSGHKPPIIPHNARPYHPSPDPAANLYRHGLNRVATEYGATCLYLWMMAHTTGELQVVFRELLLDEINHMTKFWGFGVWAFPDTGLTKISQTLTTALADRHRNPKTQGSLLHTLRRMTKTLHWSHWSPINRLTLIWTFDRVMQPLWQWHHGLNRTYLDRLFS